MTVACVFGPEHRVTHPPGGLVRNSWSGEKGPGPRGVTIRTLTVYVVSGCSSVSKTRGSRTSWYRSSSCGWGLVLPGPCQTRPGGGEGQSWEHVGGVGCGVVRVGLFRGFRPEKATRFTAGSFLPSYAPGEERWGVPRHGQRRCPAVRSPGSARAARS